MLAMPIVRNCGASFFGSSCCDQGPALNHGVIRGGSFNNDARNVRSAQRNTNDAANHGNNVGFRVASTSPIGASFSGVGRAWETQSGRSPEAWREPSSGVCFERSPGVRPRVGRGIGSLTVFSGDFERVRPNEARDRRGTAALLGESRPSAAIRPIRPIGWIQRLSKTADSQGPAPASTSQPLTSSPYSWRSTTSRSSRVIRPAAATAAAMWSRWCAYRPASVS